MTATASLAQGGIQALTFVPDQVVPLAVAPGYAALIELSPDERIENVVVGDSGAWQVTPTKTGTRLVVKPVGDGVITDLVVTTSGRRYIFLLQPAAAGGATPFVLRFDYPEPVVAATATPAIFHYHVHGDKALRPTEISDDGERTTIVWPKGVSLPATYRVDRDGQEALVNGLMVDGRYVIEGTASRYVFHRAKDSAEAVRIIPKAAR